MRSTQQPVQGISNWCPDSSQHVLTPTSLLRLCQSVKEDPCSPSRAVKHGTDWWHQDLWAMETCQADSVNSLSPEEFVLGKKEILFEGLLIIYQRPRPAQLLYGKLDPGVSVPQGLLFPRGGEVCPHAPVPAV